MSFRFIVAAASLMVVGACASPTQGVAPVEGRTTSARAGEVLMATPGEVIYSETTTQHVWALSLSEDAAIGPYSVEAGEYPLEGMSRGAYFFGVGDDCAGEAAVTAGRFADAPEYLMVPADGRRTCFVPAFDHARCGPAVGEMRAMRDADAPARVTSLTFDGIEQSLDGSPPLARFTLSSEESYTSREDSLTATIPGILVAANGRFRIVGQEEGRVVLIVEQAISEAPDLTRPDLSAARAAW